MDQEYADVDAPQRPGSGSRSRTHAHRDTPASASAHASRPRIDPIRLLAYFGAGALAAAVLLWLVPSAVPGDSDRTVAPGPSTSPTIAAATSLTDAQIATAHVYQEWVHRVETAECSAAEGFPYEAQVIHYVDDLPMVADYLGVVPEPLNRDKPVPQLRQPDLYLNTYGTTYETVPGTANCRTPAVDLSGADSATVTELVERARTDADFQATIAEQAWVHEHPAEVTHLFALLRVDRGEPVRSDTAAHEYWSRVYAVVDEVLSDEMVWVPAARTTADAYVQTTGVLGSGGAVAVRVGRDDAPLGVGSYLTRVDRIRCADITMSAAVRMPWGTASDLADAMDALTPACNALIGAGFVEAESLAEVYWD